MLSTKKFLMTLVLNILFLFSSGVAFSSAIQLSTYSMQTWNNCTSSYIAYDSREFSDNCYYYYGKNVSIDLKEGDSIRINTDVYQFIDGKKYDEGSLLNKLNIEKGQYSILNDGEIAIPITLATKYKIDVGDYMFVSGKESYKVKYIYRNFYDIKNPSIYSTGNVVFLGGSEKISDDFVYAGFGTDTGVYNVIYTFGKAKNEFFKTIIINVSLISIISIIIQVEIIVLFRKQELKNLYKDCVSGSVKSYLSSILGVNIFLHMIPATIASILLAIMGYMISAITVFCITFIVLIAKISYLYIKVH